MNNEIKKSAHDWLKEPEFATLTILDPDGFDRSSAEGYEKSMSELITRGEFDKRLAQCTISWNVNDMMTYAAKFPYNE